MRRWWVYFGERFPLHRHGPLVVAFSGSAVLYAALLGKGEPRWGEFVAAFVVCLLFFLQLRIADEFKDAEEDARYRPERPVPRGLVALRELGWLFGMAAAAQLVVAWWLEARLVWVLVAAWFYLAGMSVEFGVREWLKARPITYLWSHMLIMPLVDFFATACHWLPARGEAPGMLGWFLAASFGNGLVIELGRKLRVPETEQEGVPTYSKLWGTRRAVLVWWVVVVLTLGCGWRAAGAVGFAGPAAGVLGAWALASGGLVWAFSQGPGPRGAKRFELWSAVNTLVLYVTLGPLAWWWLR